MTEMDSLPSLTNQQVAHLAEIKLPSLRSYDPTQLSHLVRRFFGEPPKSCPQTNNHFVVAARKGKTISFYPDGKVKVIKG